MKIVLNEIQYEIVEDYRSCFNLSEVQDKMNDTDYFDNYDYILGDYSYDKLRLKGFYKKENKNAKEFNNYDNIKNYIKDFCSYGCRYFILKKISDDNKKNH